MSEWTLLTKNDTLWAKKLAPDTLKLLPNNLNWKKRVFD